MTIKILFYVIRSKTTICFKNQNTSKYLLFTFCTREIVRLTCTCRHHFNLSFRHLKFKCMRKFRNALYRKCISDDRLRKRMKDHCIQQFSLNINLQLIFFVIPLQGSPIPKHVLSIGHYKILSIKKFRTRDSYLYFYCDGILIYCYIPLPLYKNTTLKGHGHDLCQKLFFRFK